MNGCIPFPSIIFICDILHHIYMNIQIIININTSNRNLYNAENLMVNNILI